MSVPSLSPKQFEVVRVLYIDGPLTGSDLVSRIDGAYPEEVYARLSAIQGKGYVVPRGEGGRGTRVAREWHLTPAGRAMVTVRYLLDQEDAA